MSSKHLTNKDKIISTLLKTKALKFGDFTLASGAKSKYYIDLRVIPNYPLEFENLTNIAIEYIKKNIPSIEGITAVPLAGIPFGVLIASKLKKPFYILRKEQKEHGLQKMIEGELKKNQKILLVDDLITSGFSKVFAIEALRNEGAEVKHLFVFIDRTEEGLEKFEQDYAIKVHSLINAKDILAKNK